MKDWLSRWNHNKRKTVDQHITHLMWSLVLLLTISLRLAESCSELASECLPSLTLSSLTFAALQKLSQGNFGKFQRSGGGRWLALLKKIVNFWRFENGSINLLGITSEESWSLISPIMLLKHAYMGWKFQRTLKLSMSFSLEHFLISVAISTQVASVPLK